MSKTKIIGFLITKEKQKIDIDFFKVGLTQFQIMHNDFYIYLWGIGDIKNYIINNKYSLSFPLHDNLLDRNILISLEDKKIIVENDWLGSIPVFYNLEHKIVSTIPMFCSKTQDIDEEGFINFCEFGYSVFEHTVFKDMKFMRYYSKLTISNSQIIVENKEDPVLADSIFYKETSEKDVIDLLQNYMSKIENQLSGDIIIPTSGGYDSRLLNYLIQNKKRIKSFTYGISKDQGQSSEVVYAKKISEIYNTQWQQIELTNFYKYIDEWFQLYGVSTHLHGMYHIEFYKKILKLCNCDDATFVSGIIGDAWAEYNKISDIKNVDDLIKLGYTHGVSINSKALKISTNNKVKNKVFTEIGKFLNDDKLRTIFAMRTKIILISYLTQLPEYFGFPVWTPFLNFENVRAMISLPDNIRKKRIWQKEFFKKNKLYLEGMNLQVEKSNNLDYIMMMKNDFENLDIEKLSKYVNSDQLKHINKTINNKKEKISIKNQLLSIPKIGGGLRLLGFSNTHLDALHEYIILKAIEKAL